MSIPPDDQRPPLVPSLVYVHDGQARRVSIGQAVLDAALDQQKDNRLFRNFKRGIVASHGPPPRLIDGQSWQDRDAGYSFLRGLVATLPDSEIDQLVLTAPVVSFESYLNWLSEVMPEAAAGPYPHRR